MPFFDLSGLLGGARGGDPWAGAADLAAAIASEGGAEPNLDPLVRIRIEELVRVAELHVAQATGIALPSNTAVTPVTRGEWTRRTPQEFAVSLQELGEWFAQGKLNPHVSAKFPLERAAEALRLMADRKVKGKVVVTVGE